MPEAAFVLSNLPEVKFENRAAYFEGVELLKHVGVLDRNDMRKLYQSCHLIQLGTPKDPRFFVAHYKMLFMLDGRPTPNSLSHSDVGRLHFAVQHMCRLGIASTEYDWRLLKACERSEIKMIAVGDETYQKKQKYNMRSKQW